MRAGHVVAVPALKLASRVWHIDTPIGRQGSGGPSLIPESVAHRETEAWLKKRVSDLGLEDDGKCSVAKVPNE